MRKKTSDLVQITDIQFQHSQAKLQTVANEEQAIRKALADLESQRHISGTHDDMIALRSLGADIMWQVWVDRKRSELQTQLAQALVRKAIATDELRRTFGKNQTAAALALHQITHRKKQQSASRLRQEQARLVVKP